MSLFPVLGFVLLFTHLAIPVSAADGVDDPWGRGPVEAETPKKVLKDKKRGSRSPASYRPGSIHEQSFKKAHPAQIPAPTTPESSVPTQTSPGGEDSFGLTGDWGGLRKNWDQHGVGVAVVYKGDFFRNFSGGVQSKNSYLDNLDLKVSIDAEKAFGLKGLSFFVYGLGNSGAKRGGTPGVYAGAVQGVDNIETTNDDFKLYEFWAQYTFEAEHLSVLVGLHDLNSEFYVTDSSNLMLNPSHGIGYEISQSGASGPSIFPYAAPALRLRLEPSKRIYVQSGIFNGPSAENSTNGSHFEINARDGFLLINEVGISGTEESPYKLGLGYWSYTKTFDSLKDASPVNSSGAYVLGDRSFDSHLSAFIRYGMASSESFDGKDNLGLGVVYKGVLPFRPDDRLGLGMTRVTPTDESQKPETQFEATYRFEAMKGVAVQPDFQYITHPGYSGTVPNALLGALRLELSL